MVSFLIVGCSGTKPAGSVSLVAEASTEIIKGEPSWWSKPKQSKEYYFAKGSGEIKMQAVLMGLISIDRKISDVYTNSNFSEIDTISYTIRHSFTALRNSSSKGNVIEKVTGNHFNIASASRLFFKETRLNEDSEIKQEFSSNQKLTYNNGKNRSASIEYIIEEEGIPEDSNVKEKYSIYYKNAGEYFLINELKKYGYEFKFGFGKDDIHYVLIYLKKSLIDSLEDDQN